MTLQQLHQAVLNDRINITAHAQQEAANDSLSLADVFVSLANGQIIESYPTDRPYPSALVLGFTADGNPVHSVWAYDAVKQIAVLVTVYRPDPDRWESWSIRSPR